MNQIRAIQALNKKEIENGISPEASWHTDYRDTAFVYFGGLPYDLSEGDVITIFSQFGEPVFLKLARDKDSGKSKGFGWLKYDDQRSTDLAVDNLGGAEVGGRLVRVDHARYQARDDEDPEEFKVGWEDMLKKEGKVASEDEGSQEEEQKPILPEERELALLMRDHDEDDPMKGFLIEEKKKEVEEARQRADKKDRKHKHRHHQSHRSRRDGSEQDRQRRSRGDDTPVDREDRYRKRESRNHRNRAGEERNDDRRPDRDRRRDRRDDGEDRYRDEDRRRDRRDDEDRGRDGNGDRRRHRDRDRRRHDREEGEGSRHGRRRDDHDDRKPRQQDRSRSPRQHRD